MPTLLKIRRQSNWQTLVPAARYGSLEISIGNHRCTGDLLVPQIEWAREHFPRLQFSVGDTLNAHNYVSVGHAKYGILSSDEAQKVALSEGDAWIHENSERITCMLTPGSYEIWRWNEWLAEPGVQAAIKGLTDLFSHNDTLQALLARERFEYLRRRRIEADRLSPDALESLGRHVIEELAVFHYQAQSGACVHLYPGDLAVLRGMKGLPISPPALRDGQYVLFDLLAS